MRTPRKTRSRSRAVNGLVGSAPLGIGDEPVASLVVMMQDRRGLDAGPAHFVRENGAQERMLLFQDRSSADTIHILSKAVLRSIPSKPK